MCNKNSLHFSIELSIFIDTETSLTFNFETFVSDVLIIFAEIHYVVLNFCDSIRCLLILHFSAGLTF